MADGGSGIPSSRLSNKKSFEYKMSKKVAELTQVVHMLFSRNHEREVELEATKEAYELEIVNIIADARKRIEALENRVADEARKTEANAARIESKYEQKIAEQKKESEKHLSEVKSKNEGFVKEVSRLKSEINTLEEGLKKTKQEAMRNHFSSSRRRSDASKNVNENGDDITATGHGSGSASSSSNSSQKQEDVASPRLSVTPNMADLNQVKEDLRVKEIENENLKHQVATHVQNQRESDTALVKFKMDLEKTEGELRLRIAQLIDDVTQTNKAKEKVQVKNKTLETDVKNLKKLLERRREAEGQEASKNRKGSASASSINSRLSKSSDAVSKEAQEEIERLRREIKWYRMELSNREGNFNRMFADSNPIRLGGMAAPSLAITRQRSDMSAAPHSGPAHSSRSSDDGSHKVRSPPNRLPTLGMDGRQRDRETSRSKLGHNSGGGAKGSSGVKEKHTPRSITSGYT